VANALKSFTVPKAPRHRFEAAEGAIHPGDFYHHLPPEKCRIGSAQTQAAAPLSYRSWPFFAVH
jgi:hypothetical protein